jgi:2-polyprenyl-3-methyl-5-hydroxy-6-metoxy-1,4-benzoquinol methylase
MTRSADGFYDDMASSYHLIFDDWDQAIERQRAILTRLMLGTVLDCTCGIGTQALGLARAGYDIEGGGTTMGRSIGRRCESSSTI